VLQALDNAPTWYSLYNDTLFLHVVRWRQPEISWKALFLCVQ